MINQKNYYTEFLKREEQYLAFRAPQEEATARMVQAARDKDRALAFGAPPDGAAEQVQDDAAEDNALPSTQDDSAKLVIIHVGSQNLRIGFGTDALPKSLPMVIARKWHENEAEEGDGEPSPKRLKVDGVVPAAAYPEKWFGEDVRALLSNLALKTVIANVYLSLRTSIRPCAPS
jgi:actin-related protein 8